MQFVLFVKLGPTSSPIFVLSHLFYYLSHKSVIHELWLKLLKTAAAVIRRQLLEFCIINWFFAWSA